MYIVLVIVLVLMVIQNFYILIAFPKRYKTWIPIFQISLGLISVITAILYYWDAYRPKVGPVGNGPNHSLIEDNFLIMLVTGGCFLIMGILSLVLRRKFKSK